MKLRILVYCSIVLGISATVFIPQVIASRNSSGVYSSPSGNFVTQTTISSSVMNGKLNDIGTELTSSLDRSGRGAMLAPLQCYSGSVSTPGLTFSSDTGSGLYRIGSHDIGFAINGTKVEEWTGGADTITGLLTVNAASTVAITANGLSTGAGVLGVGGVTAGIGVEGIGGTNNGKGVYGVGTGGGSGVEGVGGITVGAVGGSFTGSADGGVGVQGFGTVTSAGGSFTPGTHSTLSSPRNAVEVSYGGVGFTNIIHLNTGVGVSNKLLPDNIVKAWGTYSSTGSGHGVTLSDGFNITSCISTTTYIECTLSAAMANTAYAVIANSGGGADAIMPGNKTTTTFRLVDFSIVGGTYRNCDVAAECIGNFLVIGAQN